MPFSSLRHRAVLSQDAFRVVLLSCCLSVVHLFGLLVALYLLVDRLSEPDMPEKDKNHVCTTAVFCPFYYVFKVRGSKCPFWGGYVVSRRTVLWVFFSTNLPLENC